MEFSFMPLPRAATTTLCSTELLLAALLHATSCTATTLFLFSDLYASTKPIRCNSYSLRTTAFLLLSKPPENSGNSYYARILLLAKINIDITQHTSPKVPAPQQGCSTAHKRIWGTNDSSSASFDHQSWCPSHNLRPVTKSNLCKTFPMKTLLLCHAYQVTLKLWCKFYNRNGVLATNNINYTQCTSPKVPAPYPGSPAKSRTLNWLTQHVALPLIADGDALFATSVLLPGPFSSVFLALPFYNLCHQTSSTCPFYLINQMAVLHPTSNNTICDCTFMCPSKLFSSPISSWLWHPQCQEAATLSLFQLHWVYKQANSSQIILYRLCLCLDNTTACSPWMFHAQMTRVCSWDSSLVPAKRP